MHPLALFIYFYFLGLICCALFWRFLLFCHNEIVTNRRVFCFQPYFECGMLKYVPILDNKCKSWIFRRVLLLDRKRFIRQLRFSSHCRNRSWHRSFKWSHVHGQTHAEPHIIHDHMTAVWFRVANIYERESDQNRILF